MGWIQKFYVGLGFKNGPTYNSARNYGIYTYRNREWKCLISILALQIKQFAAVLTAKGRIAAATYLIAFILSTLVR